MAIHRIARRRLAPFTSTGIEYTNPANGDRERIALRNNDDFPVAITAFVCDDCGTSFTVEEGEVAECPNEGSHDRTEQLSPFGAIGSAWRVPTSLRDRMSGRRDSLLNQRFQQMAQQQPQPPTSIRAEDAMAMRHDNEIVLLGTVGSDQLLSCGRCDHQFAVPGHLDFARCDRCGLRSDITVIGHGSANNKKKEKKSKFTMGEVFSHHYDKIRKDIDKLPESFKKLARDNCIVYKANIDEHVAMSMGAEEFKIVEEREIYKMLVEQIAEGIKLKIQKDHTDGRVTYETHLFILTPEEIFKVVMDTFWAGFDYAKGKGDEDGE